MIYMGWLRFEIIIEELENIRMLAENIGFDYNEEEFVGFAAEGTLGHFVVGEGGDEGQGWRI